MANRNPIQDYVTVAERIVKFYDLFNEGRIITAIVEHDQERGFILMRAEVYRNADDALPAATGHAYEVKSEGHVQQKNYVEVAETSCVGRALANLNFETKRKGNETTRREAADSGPGRIERSSITDQQKAEIEQLRNDLQGLGALRSREQLAAHLMGETKKRDIMELSEIEAASYIRKLKLLLDAKRPAPKLAGAQPR